MPLQYTHLCVVNAFTQWQYLSRVDEAYLFRKIRKNDRVAEENEPMVCNLLTQFVNLKFTQYLDIRTVSGDFSE